MELTLTPEQKKSVAIVVDRFKIPADKVKLHPLFGGNGCVMIEAGGMWLGIERDGYTHS